MMPTLTKLKGNDVALYGDQVNVGDKAPVLTLPNSGLEEVTIGGTQDSAQLIVAVPSLDTPVCAMETTKFNQSSCLCRWCNCLCCLYGFAICSKKILLYGGNRESSSFKRL